MRKLKLGKISTEEAKIIENNIKLSDDEITDLIYKNRINKVKNMPECSFEDFQEYMVCLFNMIHKVDDRFTSLNIKEKGFRMKDIYLVNEELYIREGNYPIISFTEAYQAKENISRDAFYYYNAMFDKYKANYVLDGIEPYIIITTFFPLAELRDSSELTAICKVKTNCDKKYEVSLAKMYPYLRKDIGTENDVFIEDALDKLVDKYISELLFEVL